MRVLADEGLIYRVPGLGYYVSYGLPPRLNPVNPDESLT